MTTKRRVRFLVEINENLDCRFVVCFELASLDTCGVFAQQFIQTDLHAESTLTINMQTDETSRDAAEYVPGSIPWPACGFALTATGRDRSPRDLQPEWMDDPAIDPIEHVQALAGLARLNRFSGVAGLMYRYVRRLTKARLLSSRTPRPLKILDVASGGGDVPVAWMRRAKCDGIDLNVTLLDISPLAIEQQQRLAHAHGVTVSSIQMNCLNESLPSGFDLVTNSLFMHHLEVTDAAHLIRQMRAATDNAILVCDLERSRFNAGFVAVAGRVLSRSKVVHHDGPQSVRGAFTRSEFAELCESALRTPMHIHNAFPCRFIAYHVT